MMRPSQSTGFSLIEVLITVFVVGVGLLSVAGLQVYAKQSNFDAVQRTTAAALAQDIIERMRANPEQLAAYVTTAKQYQGFNELNPAPAPSVDCTVTSCTPAQQVVFDQYQWSQALFGASEVASDGSNAGGLASATGCVTLYSGATCTVYVTIAWKGVTSLSGTDTRTGTQYQCGSGNTDYTGSNGQPLRRLIVVQTFIDPGNGTQC
jgi:type IV pilus assembly protein PilV